MINKITWIGHKVPRQGLSVGRCSSNLRHERGTQIFDDVDDLVVGLGQRQSEDPHAAGSKAAA